MDCFVTPFLAMTKMCDAVNKILVIARAPDSLRGTKQSMV